jgi:hypothetical protein
MSTLSTHLIVPSLALRRWRNVSSANNEVTEVLTLESLKCVALDHRLENGKDLRFCDRFYDTVSTKCFRSERG